MLIINNFMLRNLKKKIKLNHFKKIRWYFLKKKIFLVVTVKTTLNNYILVPQSTDFFKISNSYFVNSFLSNSFYSLITKWSEQLIKPLQKKLFFKGLGFKFKYSTVEKNKLELKLGYSHRTTILIPTKQIQVFLIKKNRIAVEGFNYNMVGNFAHKLRMLRFPDSYNGKGFWYKNETKILKPIKKT